MWKDEATSNFYDQGMNATEISKVLGKSTSTITRLLKKDNRRYIEEKKRRKIENASKEREKKRERNKKWWQDNRGCNDDLTAKEMALIQKRDAMLLSRDLAPKGRALYPEMAYHQSAYDYDPEKSVYIRKDQTDNGAHVSVLLPKIVQLQSSNTTSDYKKLNQIKHT